MVEIYKIKNNLNVAVIDFIFESKNNTYNLRNFQEFATKRKRTVKMGLENFKLQTSAIMVSFAWNLKNKLTR